MNTKGLVELIVLNIGKDRKVLNDQTFAICVLMAIFTTFITTPIVISIYKPAKKSLKSDYKHRTVQRQNPNTQLRLLTCFYTNRNIPTLINIIEASRGTQKSQSLTVYALHLMEFSERPSAILMVHKARKNGLPFWNKLHPTNSSHVVVAFEAFRQLSNVVIRPMTALSAMHNIHEDICNTAESKRIAMVIIPFHKHQRLDGSLETTRGEFRGVNLRVLNEAKCSVGVLVDRGFGGGAQVAASNLSSRVAVFFFGGNDDCEALAYGVRMAEHPGIRLTVVRFIAGGDLNGQELTIDVTEESNRSIESDRRVLSEVRKLVDFDEKAVNSLGEIVEVVKGYGGYNLILTGRVPVGPAARVLTGRMECPELGPVGNLLIRGDFATSASVFVVQQYNGGDARIGSTSVGDFTGDESDSG